MLKFLTARERILSVISYLYTAWLCALCVLSSERALQSTPATEGGQSVPSPCWGLSQGMGSLRECRRVQQSPFDQYKIAFTLNLSFIKKDEHGLNMKQRNLNLHALLRPDPSTQEVSWGSR